MGKKVVWVSGTPEAIGVPCMVLNENIMRPASQRTYNQKSKIFQWNIQGL